MGQVCKIIAGFEDTRVHEGRQGGVRAALQPLDGDLDGLCLQQKSSQRTSSSTAAVRGRSRVTDFAILELELELDLGTFNGLVDELGGYPALSGIGLPGPCADIVSRCHGGGDTARRRAGPETKKGRDYKKEAARLGGGERG